MNKKTKTSKALKFILWLACSVILSLVIVFLLHRPSLEVVHQWKQPDEITYDQWGPYYMSVIESDLDWRGFPLYVERNYFIYVGRDSGKPSHGHMVKFSFHAFSDDLKTFLSKADAQWTDKGVELILPSGHRVFIPRDMFTGGR